MRTGSGPSSLACWNDNRLAGLVVELLYRNETRPRSKNVLAVDCFDSCIPKTGLRADALLRIVFRDFERFTDGDGNRR